MTFRLRHLLAALILHLMFFGLLVSGVQCSGKAERAPVIQAVLLNPSRQEAAEQKKREAEALARKKKEEADRQKREEEAQKKKAEEEQKQKAIADRKKAAEELKAKQAADARKKKADEAKQKKEAANKKKADDAARKKKQQEEQRERDEQATRELQEKARLEQDMRQETMRREIDKEQAARELSERQKKQAQWGDALTRHVARNWTRPAAVTEDFSCTLHVQLLPDGSVTLAKIAKSCGNAQLDKSVEDAVYRASPLPLPSDPAVFDRDLIINFEP